MEDCRGYCHRGCITGCGNHALSFLCHAIDRFFFFWGFGIEDFVEDGLGIGGLFGADDVKFLLQGRVASEYLGDLAADELECDEYWLV